MGATKTESVGRRAVRLLALGVGGFVLLVIVLATLAGLGFDTPNAPGSLDGIKAQVAADAVAQYQIAKRGDDKIQTCVQAGFVTAAYLQAQDEASYRKWKAIEKSDCTAAGVPR